MAKVTPEEDPKLNFPPEALPAKPDFDLPLWNKHTKGKLGNPLDKGNLKQNEDRVKFQQKLFPSHMDFTDKQFLDHFRKTSLDAMKPVASIMGCLGCCMFPSSTQTLVFNANDFIGDRNCALKPSCSYDNNALEVVISTPKRCCCFCAKRATGLPILVAAPAVGIDGDHDVWKWQGKAWASGLKAVVVHVCFRKVPESDAASCMMDMVAAVKWAAAKGAEYGGDVSRIGLLSSSAGAFITTISALELAARSESSLVKTVFLEVPGIFPDNMLGPYDGMCSFQQFINSRVIKGQYIWFAGKEWQKAFDEKDATLHCLHAPAALLQKLSRHVIITGEFDDFRWQTDQYAAKLNQAGVLADYVVYPGAVHMAIPMNHGSLMQEAVEKYLY